MRHMNDVQTWSSDGQRAQERTDDHGGDLPLPEDYAKDALPLLTESADSSLQAWEGMAIRTFGSGTVDSRPDQKSPRIIEEILH